MNTIEQIIKTAEALILNKTGKSLSFIQKAILVASLGETKKNYAQIALENNYSENYIRQLVAPKLWQLLSEILEVKVNRTNCRAVLEQRLNINFFQRKLPEIQNRKKIDLEPPEGQVPLTSTFYIERGLEQICYAEISEPHAFIHIKAPQKMGKTSFMVRILAYGKANSYHTVRLSLHCAETKVFTSLEKFLRWFCVNVTYQLGIESKLEEYWHEEMGALMNCTIYFQNYLLPAISHPVILALDEVNKLFEYPDIYADFLTLLRSWYEETRDIWIWQNLRLIIVKSTYTYGELNKHNHPFNLGLTIHLPPFTKWQVADLAKLHGLELTEPQLEVVMELTGGFPYLVRQALYHSVLYQLPIETLLLNTATDTETLSQDLQEHFWSRKQNVDLLDRCQQII
ncbi:AAA-like domain-containing protein [Tolypothrix sp. FACHB-123]|uniref:AAA-like domain-containing protein n=1 Tax=Tolypothrix sp. FACHB-123 TaxID=2692868 RepID=UPI0016888C72|nr:AAA-like domain-containing protein [Tolypothrix sp. FACHB-123]MBD2356045.1 AAA-like domain-containing protein [Tolypothrix sp. FACHB-123]